MRLSSITSKLYILLVIFFVVFLSVALYSETLFFENFYNARRSDTLDVAMQSFLSAYEGGDWDEFRLKNQTYALEQAHNVRLAIVDSSNNIQNEPEYAISVLDYSGRLFEVPLNAALVPEQMLLFANRTEGSVVEIEGDIVLVDGITRLNPLRISLDGEDLMNLKSAYGYDGRHDTLDKISGTILKAVLPNENDVYKGVHSQQLWRIVDYWYYQEYHPGEGVMPQSSKDQRVRPESFIYHDPTTNEQLLVRSYQTVNKGELQYALLVGSRQPILEAVKTLQDYFIYVLMFAIVFVSIFAYIFSRMVARPLIRVNEAAKQMAKLEFDQYIEVRSDDEIGSLSSSLNSLSMNLQRSIEDLHKANLQLQEDIERERRVELRRKEFVSGFSHELKTPIGIIKGFAEGIRDGIAEGREDRYINIILGEVDKLDALVLDMLELSKLQSEQYEIELGHFDLRSLLYKVTDKFGPKLKEKQLDMELNFQLEVCTRVVGDVRRIEQVVTNGLSNAIRHAMDGSAVSVSMSRWNDKVEVVISNVGKAIPDEQIPLLWERFYRVDPSRSKQEGGTGLGLAIVKNILEHHQSNYGIRNTHQGVQFYFDLHCVGSGEAYDEAE